MKTISLFNNAADTVTVDAGKPIFEQGEVTDVMYVLINGDVTVIHDGEELVTVQGGTLLGEMALLENRPHYAGAIAKTTCTLVPIDQKRFRFLVEQTPNFALDVLEIMAERLHQMNIKVSN